MEKKYDYEKMAKEGYQCECKLSGYCSLLDKEMTPRLHHLCQTSEKHRERFLDMAKAKGVHQENGKRTYSTSAIDSMNLKSEADGAIAELQQKGIDMDKPSEGLGDTIEKTLSKFGITSEKIEKILGGRGCGCSERKKWFNKIFKYRGTNTDDLQQEE